MHIWKLKVENDAPLYFSTFTLVLEWLALFHAEAGVELVMIESLYVNV